MHSFLDDLAAGLAFLLLLIFMLGIAYLALGGR